MDNFSKFGLTSPLKNKIAETLKNSLEKILTSSKTEPNLIEITAEKKFITVFFKIHLLLITLNFILELAH